MEILTALKNQLAFIEWFYKKAAQPFFSFLLFERPERHGDDTPDDRENWEKGLNVLGYCSLSLVAKAIEDYLRLFVGALGGMPDTKGSKFEKYENFLLTRTTFLWDNCPIERNRIEQINLCRNDFMHDPSINARQAKQNKKHFEKHPNSRFIASWEQVMVATMTEVEGKKPDHQFSLRVTGDELIRAIGDARRFCEFVNTQKASSE